MEKQEGIRIKIDIAGRIALAKEQREDMNLKHGDKVEFTLRKGIIYFWRFSIIDFKKRPWIGPIRQLDKGGRIVIPSEFLNLLGVQKKSDCFLTYDEKKMIVCIQF